jgi:hypothetical protein
MKKIVRVHGGMVAAAGLVFFASTGMSLETKPTLTLDLAKKMAAACEAKAKHEKWLMNIAVVDDGANDDAAATAAISLDGQANRFQCL